MSFFKTGTWYLLRNMGFVSASMFAGDWVCQRILHPNEPWNKKQSINLGITGFFVTGPMNHGVFLLLEKMFAGTSLKAIVYKMLGSCVLAAPQMSITFSSVVLLNGGTFEDMKKKVKQDIPETWVAGNVFWVPINFIQYKFTPLYYRATVGGVCGDKATLRLAFWNIYLAKQSAKPIKE